MECNLDRSLSWLFGVLDWSGRYAGKAALLMMGLAFGVLWCLVVLLCTGRLPWMVRKFL